MPASSKGARSSSDVRTSIMLPRSAALALGLALLTVGTVIMATTTTTMAAAFTLADCRPRSGMRQAQCSMLARWCAQQGVPMAWVGNGCTRTSGANAGDKAGDAGCQCGSAKEFVTLPSPADS